MSVHLWSRFLWTDWFDRVPACGLTPRDFPGAVCRRAKRLVTCGNCRRTHEFRHGRLGPHIRSKYEE